MNFDTALEMVIISSWDHIMPASYDSAVHAEYKSLRGAPVQSVQVWSVAPRGAAKLIGDYSIAHSPDVSPAAYLTSPHQAEVLGKGLAFVLRHQSEFARRSDHCTQGLVCVGPPNVTDRERAAIWRRDIGIDHAPALNILLQEQP